MKLTLLLLTFFGLWGCGTNNLHEAEMKADAALNEANINRAFQIGRAMQAWCMEDLVADRSGACHATATLSSQEAIDWHELHKNELHNPTDIQAHKNHKHK